MYYKTFDKLDITDKIDILLELNSLYDLHTERGINALKKEFGQIEPQIKGLMIEKGLYRGVKQWLLNLMKMQNYK